MKTTVYLPGILVSVYVLSIVICVVYQRLSLVALLASLGVGAITQSFTNSIVYTSVAALVVLLSIVMLKHTEGFVDVTAPLDKAIAKDAQKVRSSTYEGFNTNTPPTHVSKLVTNMKSLGFSEGFINTAANVMRTGVGTLGPASPSIEGYEDVKVEKNETPAPTLKDEKETIGMPFKLGEIPSQVKNGPHIDAGSTLMQAIKGLNPDQIKAMTNDTKQLIETQKSLMGMLGSMKPMLNDGKQLMDTFQQMFG